MAPPRRWLVIGSGGSGKSTLARRMGDILGLPVIHLDLEYWKPGWVKTPTAEWSARVDELCAGPAWIMDGNYSGTLDRRLERADAVVLLDLHPVQCLMGLLRRRFRSFTHRRPDIPEGCPDRILEWDFLRWVAMYRRTSLPKVRARLAEAPHVSVQRLRSRRQVRDFLEALRSA